MALQVWLPLNSDLKNKGVADVTVTNHGATIDNNGKIGKCYKFDGSDDYISLNSSKLYSIFKGGTQPFSIAFWVYHNDSTRAILFGDYNLPGTIGFNVELRTDHLVRFYWAGNPDKYFANSSVGLQTWTHICIVYDCSNLIVYKNGVVLSDKGPSLAQKAKASGDFYLGRDNRTGTTALNGSLNDVRIYDHCLSPKEVKEISQGLILHYKLDDPYVEPTTNYGRMWDNISIISDIASDWKLEKLGRDILKITALVDNPGYSTWGNIITRIAGPIRVTAGTACTLSCEIVDFKGSLSRLYPCSGGFGTIIGYGTYENRVYRIITHTADWNHDLCIRTSDQSNIMAGDYLIIKNTQIETKDHLTPYTNSSRNETTIIDSSGYNNNGTIVGDLTVSEDTPRYNNSISFSNKSYIIAPKEPKVKDSISICCWAFMDNWGNYNGRLLSCTESGGWNFEPNSGKMNFAMGTGVSSNTYKSITSTTTLANLNPGWHLFVGTYDGFYTKIYIDGKLEGSLTAYATKTPIYYNTTNTIFIAAEATSSDITPSDSNYFTGKLSDIRIYATALTADDVLQLYQVGASIDNMGNVHSYEIDETSTTKTKLSKTGIFETGELIEGNDKAIIEKDVDMNINEFIET